MAAIIRTDIGIQVIKKTPVMIAVVLTLFLLDLVPTVDPGEICKADISDAFCLAMINILA